MTTPATEAPADSPDADGSLLGQNIAAVHGFYSREETKRSPTQRLAERLGDAVGRPLFLVLTLAFVATWVGLNLLLSLVDVPPFDRPPFHWLQGGLALAALLVTTVVLIKQNRVALLGGQRDHLDLKLTMLIEQKTAKLIDLMEELRRDLPSVQNRLDAGASALLQPMGPAHVLAALDEERVTPDGSTSPSTAVDGA